MLAGEGEKTLLGYKFQIRVFYGHCMLVLYLNLNFNIIIEILKMYIKEYLIPSFL